MNITLIMKVVKIFIYQPKHFQNDVKRIIMSTKWAPPQSEIPIVKFDILERNTHPHIIIKLVDRYLLDSYHTRQTSTRFSFTLYNKNPIEILIDRTNWECEGAQKSKLTKRNYKKYVIRHEIMHALGYAHQSAQKALFNNKMNKFICPVMYQATRGPPGASYVCGYQLTDADFTRKIKNYQTRF